MNEWPYRNKRRAENVQRKMGLAKDRLQAEGFDSLIVETVATMVEDRKAFQVPALIQDYNEISKKFRGEVHGVIRSAFELSDAEYNDILKVLQDKNPGKNFFLEKKVDP